MKIIAAGSAVAVCLTSILFITPASHAVDGIARSNGVVHTVGRVHVLHLRGSFREMGRQYGALEKTKLRDFHADMKKLFVDKRGIAPARLNGIASELYDSYPQRFREILVGMAETSGLSLDDHIFINAFEHFLFHPDLSRSSGGACSAIAAWRPHTADGNLIFGRNYDFGDDVGAFKQYVNVAIFDPAGSGVATALVTFAGTLNATTQLNAAGLFLELNNGGMSAGGLSHTNRVSTPIELFAMMLDSSSLRQIDLEMHTTNTRFSYIINVADANNAVSYEWAPFGVKRIEGASGLLVSTNHFVGEWGLAPSTDAFFLTVTRRTNLLRLADRAKGALDLAAMKGILSTDIRGGGATSYRVESIGGNPAPYTAYQVIAEPARRRVWIRLPGYQDWIALELGPLFGKR
ncbi:MAG TPA: C45 family autoproteolytic acyltransferase/hydrolase [Spirochaetota bacterium]|nr:C45 family autoproteolytic acyltransferase/hydrolase [Spirochaetota bacterium]HNT13149.1 C45 family autoproteolytic acyltransferase/hydrolase [Spirochaetota bacterium]